MEILRILYIGEYVLVAILMLASAVGMGALIYRSNSRTQELECFFLQSCLGIGIWSYGLVFIAVLHLLYPQFIVVLVLISLFGFWRNYLQEIPHICVETHDKIFLVACFASMVPVFSLALYPPHSFDDTGYHLTTAQVFANNHYLAVPEYVRYPLFNEFMEVLFSAALCFRSDTAAQLMSMICYGLSQVGIYVTLKRFISGAFGLFGVTVFISSAIACRLAATAFVEIPTALMCLASTYASLRYVNGDQLKDRREYLVLAGVFGGFAVSCKYTAIPFEIGLGIAITIFSALSTASWKKSIAEAGMFGMSALLCSVFWFGRNYFYTGNPVFPYMWKFFGSHYVWTTWDYETLGKFHEIVRRCPLSLYGLGRALWLVSFGTNLNEFRYGFCPMFLPGLMLAVLSMVKSADRKNICVIMIPVLVFIVPWFLASQNTRFMLVILPAVALYSAWAILPIVSWLTTKNALFRMNGSSVVSLILGLTVGSVPGRVSSQLTDAYGPFPMTNQERDAFLSKWLPSYPSYVVLNSLEPGNLYAYGDEQMGYFFRNGTVMGDWFGKGSYIRIANAMRTGQELRQYLLDRKVKYLLVNKLAKALPRKLPTDIYFELHFSKMFEDNSSVVYAINGD